MPVRKILSLAILGSLVGIPASLGDDLGWAVRVNGYYVDPGDTPKVTVPGGIVVRSDNNSGAGAGIGVEYRFTRRLGVELGAMAADHGDFSVVIDPPGARIKVDDTLTIQMFSAALNVYLTPESPVDLYIGPVLAHVGYTNLTVVIDPSFPPPIGVPVTSVTIEIESDLGLGLNLGVDVPLGDHGWLFNANLRYLSTSADARIGRLVTETIDYDPLLLGVGFGYRF